jgi:predicted regulator of Ras-like GTPase activity (Roadblock/LC7/MglB family)
MNNEAFATTPGVADYGDLDWLLTSFVRRVPTIVYALAVSVDGLAIASSDQVPPDQADQLAAITSGLASLTLGAAKCMSTGYVRQTVVDMDGGCLLVMSVADRAYLAVLAEPGADLGQVGYESALLAQRVASALEPGARVAGQM